MTGPSPATLPGDPKLAAQSKTSDATTMGITLGSPGTWAPGWVADAKKVGDRFKGPYKKKYYLGTLEKHDFFDLLYFILF